MHFVIGSDESCIYYNSAVMKRKRVYWRTALIAGTWLLVSLYGCKKEVNPVEFNVTGPGTVYLSQVFDYVVTPEADQAGTIWGWTVSAATILNVSSDTKTATIAFTERSANDIVYITVTQTTSTGATSSEKVITINVIPFSTFTVTGPSKVYQTEVYNYVITPGINLAGIIWGWTVTGATLQNVSSDTKTATIAFTEKPANDTAYISITQTPTAGVTSPAQITKVEVTPFCTFDINNFTGAFEAYEPGYGTYAVNFTKDPELDNTIVNDNFWNWPGPDAVLKYTLSGDFLETVTVPKQDFVFGDGYAGWVQGNGTYNGCTHTMVVEYVVYYEGEEYAVYHEFTRATKGTMYPVLQKKNRKTIRSNK